MRLPEQEVKCLTNYKNLIESMFKKHWMHSSNVAFFNVMKGSHDKSTITGKQIRDKAASAHSEIKNVIMPLLPDNIASIASGKSLRDAFNNCILTLYKKEQLARKSGALTGVEAADD